MGARTRTRTTIRCRSDVLPPLQPYLCRDDIKLWKASNAPHNFLRQCWCGITRTTDSSNNWIGRHYISLQKFLTKVIYILMVIATIVISFSLVIAIAQDPYCRGNKSFHDRTMKFIQGNKSTELSYESVKASPLKYGDSMLNPPISSNGAGTQRLKPVKFFWGI